MSGLLQTVRAFGHAFDKPHYRKSTFDKYDCENQIFSTSKIAAKKEEWESARQGWRAYSGMRRTFPKLKRYLEETKEISTYLDTLLIDGPTEALNKFQTVSNNFALTSALFISAELALVAIPTPVLGSANNPALKIPYFILIYISLTMHTTCLIVSIHSTHWFSRIRTDADWIEYCIEHRMEDVIEKWMVAPLIIGIPSGFFAVVLSGCASFGWDNYVSAPFDIAAVVLACSCMWFSKDISVDAFSKFFLTHPPLKVDYRAIMAIYEDQAQFDELVVGPSEKSSENASDRGIPI